MPPSLASSVLYPDHDLIETVETAQQYGFESIQLYVNKLLLNPDYIDRLIKTLSQCQIQSIVIHLPNLTQINEETLKSIENLIGKLPSNTNLVGLIHFEDIVVENHGILQGTRPFLIYDIPAIPGIIIGIENSKSRVFDRNHVLKAFNLAKAHNIPFVFDIGRIMYPTNSGELNQDTKEEIYEFIVNIISKLNPEKDILHVTGKKAWGLFKTYSCALGAEGDITAPLIPMIKDFSDMGGIVVLEHENLQQAIDSLKVFEN